MDFSEQQPVETSSIDQIDLELARVDALLQPLSECRSLKVELESFEDDLRSLTAQLEAFDDNVSLASLATPAVDLRASVAKLQSAQQTLQQRLTDLVHSPAPLLDPSLVQSIGGAAQQMSNVQRAIASSTAGLEQARNEILQSLKEFHQEIDGQLTEAVKTIEEQVSEIVGDAIDALTHDLQERLDDCISDALDPVLEAAAELIDEALDELIQEVENADNESAGLQAVTEPLEQLTEPILPAVEYFSGLI
jgi:chromosome segregation ATPase